MDEYAAFGVRFYWITRLLRSREIFELSAGRHARAAHATEQAMSTVPGCEELSIDLNSLWREMAELGSEEAE